jgi:nicotinamidase/pyrazinamidase
MTTDMPRYDETTALIVVDVQNDFADPEGGLYVPGGEDVVPIINAHIATARERARRSSTRRTGIHRTPRTSRRMAGPGRSTASRTPGVLEFHPDLEVDGPAVKKGVDGGDGYSGFSVRDPVSGEEDATELGSILEDAGVTHVVVTGLAGDVCVKETALDARRLGYEVWVPLEMTRFVELEPGDDQRATRELREAGVTVVL